MARAKSATINLKVRMKEPLRARIERSAKQNGVSMNTEAVRRLEESFRREERETTTAAQAAGGVYASFGRLDNFTVMRLLANAIQAIEETTGERWTKNAAIHHQVKTACNTILDIFKSAEPAIMIEGFKITEADHLGVETAISVVEKWQERIGLVDALMAHGKQSDAD